MWQNITNSDLNIWFPEQHSCVKTFQHKRVPKILLYQTQTKHNSCSLVFSLLLLEFPEDIDPQQLVEMSMQLRHIRKDVNKYTVLKATCNLAYFCRGKNILHNKNSSFCLVYPPQNPVFVFVVHVVADIPD